MESNVEPVESALTSDELIARANALYAQAEEKRREEKKAAIEEIKAKMAKYGIELSDLDPSVRKSKRRKGMAAVNAKKARYRGPNGEVWSCGPGRRPAWVREILSRGEDLEKYRVPE